MQKSEECVRRLPRSAAPPDPDHRVAAARWSARLQHPRGSGRVRADRSLRGVDGAFSRAVRGATSDVPGPGVVRRRSGLPDPLLDADECPRSHAPGGVALRPAGTCQLPVGGPGDAPPDCRQGRAPALG